MQANFVTMLKFRRQPSSFALDKTFRSPAQLLISRLRFGCVLIFLIAISNLKMVTFKQALVVIDDDSFEVRNTKLGLPVHTLASFFSVPLEDIKIKIPVSLLTTPKDTPLAILFSSGSTGDPKGVIKTHYNQVAYNMESLTFSPFGPIEGTVTCHQPLPHLSGFFTVQVSITAGLTIVFNPEFEVQSFLETVEKYKVCAECLPLYLT